MEGVTLDTFPSELLYCIVRFLKLCDAIRLATTGKRNRQLLVLSAEADAAWQDRARSDFGLGALRRVASASSAFALYRSVHSWRGKLESMVEVVGGSIEMSCDGVDVVACPCLRTLHFFPFLVRFFAGFASACR